MAQAYLIKPGKPGRIELVPQRRVEKRPYTNCAVVDNTRQAIRAGLAFPSIPKWVARFRDATGIPEVNPDGSTNGTRASDRMRAWALLAPWYPIEFRGWDPDALFDELEAGLIDASLTIQYGLLPDEQRRWSPNFTGGHQIGLLRARRTSSRREVRIVDPLGLPPYDGDWVPWQRILDAAPTSFAGGLLYLQTIAPGATGMSIAIEAQAYHAPGTKAKIPKGTPTFTFSAAQHNLIAQKGTSAAQQRSVDATVTVRNMPTGRKPTGTFVHVTDGFLAGRYARLSDVTLIEAQAPTDCEAQVAAAVLPLRQEIDAQEAAIAAAMSSLEAVA